jgi:hypothetical protein
MVEDVLPTMMHCNCTFFTYKEDKILLLHALSSERRDDLLPHLGDKIFQILEKHSGLLYSGKVTTLHVIIKD